ncbi:hypothetical protein HB847_15065 [Listeria booriae]|uniref:DUF6792 domain-containing protein n=1 Tax=Listeria booriae TaxID=1552123 RepID=A0A841Y9S1_9LIST|nr:DUF6792 domain-containing protein [Listeria booriae]MBC1373672.1 hypothetical protein [Listeria booriae]
MTSLSIKANQYWSFSTESYKGLEVGSFIQDVTGSYWHIISKTDTSNGYQGYAVVNRSEFYKVRDDITAGRLKKAKYENVVIMSRGTEPTKFDGDLSTDISYVVVGKNTKVKSNQFSDAEAFYKDVNQTFQPSKVYVTGHSLGGAISQFLSAEYNLEGVTYAAPNVYRILSPEAKKRVDNGYMDRLMTDYTHDGEQIGVFSQWGAPLIGKQYIATGSGHGLQNFGSHFDASGSVKLKISPEDIQMLGNRIKNVAVNIDTPAGALEAYREAEEKAVRKMIRQATDELYGGKYSLLDENDIDNAMAEIAKNKTGGMYRFYDEPMLDTLIQDLQRKRRDLLEFGEDVGYAGYKMKEKDAELGAILAKELNATIHSGNSAGQATGSALGKLGSDAWMKTK